MPDNTSQPSESLDPMDTPQTTSDSDRAKWTVMVYLAGDNNLADECVFALTEMKAAMIDPSVRVVAQFDPTARRLKTKRFVLNRALHDNKNGNSSNGKPVTGINTEAWRHRKSIIDDVVPGGLPPGRIPFRRIKGDAKPSNPRGQVGVAVATAPVAEDETDTDSGDPKLLFDFISWTVDNYPADHYMVILSGHGSGVLEQEFLRDESSRGTLTIKELGEVFKAVKEELTDKTGKRVAIDILGFDSCVMGMAEVCYELAGTVKYMVSSESFSPQAGWPYARIIESVSKNIKAGKDSSPEAVGLIAVDEHVDFYLDYAEANGLSVDLSLLDVEKIPYLVQDVKNLAGVLKAALNKGEKEFRDQLVLAHWEAQSYNGEVYVDLRDFCDCLRMRYGPPAAADHPHAAPVSREPGSRASVYDACTAVIDRIDHELVKQSCYMGVIFQYSFGISIYFPWAEVAPDYNKEELKFIDASGWRDFLNLYVEKTRRQPRRSTPVTDGASLSESATASATLMTLEENIRKTPTDQKGPANVLIRSMRNPPIKVLEDGLSECTKKRLGIEKKG